MYKKSNSFGDRDRGSSFGDRKSFGGRPSFGGDRGGRGRDERPAMHKATCAECDKTCEVPFRPTGEKPVYCSDCFGGNTRSQGLNTFKKEYVSTPRASAPDTRIDDIKRQLAGLEAKLDMFLQKMEGGSKASVKETAAAPAPKKSETKETKTVAKKTVKVEVKEVKEAPVKKVPVKKVIAKKVAKKTVGKK